MSTIRAPRTLFANSFKFLASFLAAFSCARGVHKSVRARVVRRARLVRAPKDHNEVARPTFSSSTAYLLSPCFLCASTMSLSNTERTAASTYTQRLLCSFYNSPSATTSKCGGLRCLCLVAFFTLP